MLLSTRPPACPSPRLAAAGWKWLHVAGRRGRQSPEAASRVAGLGPSTGTKRAVSGPFVWIEGTY